MKTLMIAILTASISAFAQSPPPGTISHPSDSSIGTNSSVTSPTAEISGSGMTFTNTSGQTFSIEQLANQLSSLRSAVDQTLPVLIAFNESYSNSATGTQTVAGKLSNLLSGALNRNSSSTSSTNQANGQWNNLLGGLQKLLNRNSNTNSETFNPTTVRDLGTLQTELQPVASTLQTLNVTSNTNGISSTENVLSPTGRK